MTETDWLLLSRYAAGECDADERARVERWLDEDPARRAWLAAIERAGALADRTVSPRRRLELKADMERRIAELRAGRVPGEQPVPSVAGRNPVRRLADRQPAPPFADRRAVRPSASRPYQPAHRLWRIAAAVMLVAGGSFVAYAALRNPAAPSDVAQSTVHTITTPRGQRMSLRLADGTQVLLAPASTLRFAATYGARDRAVELEGEAVFSVTHDARRPFVVRAGALVAKDLGTRFVVRAYGDDAAADVVVAEGVVAVSRGSSADSVVLVPGDRARMTADSGVALTRGVPLDGYFGWTEGRLVFRRTPLREAAARIGRWHDVEIRVASPEAGERVFSAAFGPDESASQMIGSIAAALRLRARQTGPRQYTLDAE